LQAASARLAVAQAKITESFMGVTHSV
jgi:hypothetical protein